MLARFSTITVSSATSHFFCKNPALLYGLALLFGLLLTFHGAIWLWVAPVTVFLLIREDSSPHSGRARRLLFLASLITVMGYAYGSAHYRFPDLPVEGDRGTGEFHISRVSERQRHGVSRWHYQGELRQFVSRSGQLARHLPVSISLPKGSPRLDADQVYSVQGWLREIGPCRYMMRVQGSSALRPLRRSWGFAEWRYRQKERVANQIKRWVRSPDSAALLLALATGDFDHRVLRYELAQLGVQHVMAISGFHFAILATFLHVLLRCWLPYRYLSLCLALCLSSYYLFIGSGPSIQRAWVSALVVLGSSLFERRSVGSNTLGVAMLFVLIGDPLLCLHQGFQYSFLATGAILLVYPVVLAVLERLVRLRPLYQVVDMSNLNQHIYLLLSVFRGAFALTVSVHIPMFFLVCSQGQSFPLLGFFANLLFPFLVSGVLLLLLLSFLAACVWEPLAQGISRLNEALVSQLIDWVYHSPLSLRPVLALDISPWLSVIAILTLFVGAIYYMRVQEERLHLNELLFV